MYGIIYKITNKVNGKIYIGLTKQKLQSRFRGHLSDARKALKNDGRVCYFQNALLKYGKENFILEQIDQADTKEELCRKEEYWISYYNSTDRSIGYNVSEGGEGGDTCSEFIWVTDGKENRYIYYKDDIPDGFRRGRTICKNFANANVGKIHIYKEDKSILIFEEELEKYIEDGWKRGMPYRGDSWRDNIRKSKQNLSEEAKKNIRNAMIKYHKEHPHSTNSGSFKKGMVSSTIGTRSVTDGVKNKFIPKDEVEEFLKNNIGWRLGNTQHHNKKGKDING